MHLPQSHRDTEPEMYLPQSHGDTEPEMHLPQSHGGTEEIEMDPRNQPYVTTENLNHITEQIIGFAITIHRTLGPGLLEPTYAAALRIELEGARIEYQQEVRVPALYKGHLIGEYRIDFIIEDLV